MDMLAAGPRPAIAGDFASFKISQKNSRNCWAVPLAITCPDGSIGRALGYQSGGRWFETGGDPKFKGLS
ncbi:hypothetical protein Y032_0002g522 [Ancylostoma ceylanicum]|uniref:Uncharacterized protein n=1 Tax=Ancylostoma ceylanicum TaxID=53326 RepID=A0A016VZC7_9BILA|nr:hypothetical protein Y032_0002g522 [Ancylostoma ceylanicum]